MNTSHMRQPVRALREAFVAVEAFVRAQLQVNAGYMLVQVFIVLAAVFALAVLVSLVPCKRNYYNVVKSKIIGSFSIARRRSVLFAKSSG